MYPLTLHNVRRVQMNSWVVCNYHMSKLTPPKGTVYTYVLNYCKGYYSVFLLFLAFTASLILTSLYIYYLYVYIIKVKNSHHLRDLHSLLTTPADSSSQQTKEEIIKICFDDICVFGNTRTLLGTITISRLACREILEVRVRVFKN
jgi:hypothetical protein